MLSNAAYLRRHGPHKPKKAHVIGSAREKKIHPQSRIERSKIARVSTNAHASNKSKTMQAKYRVCELGPFEQELNKSTEMTKYGEDIYEGTFNQVNVDKTCLGGQT
jgi:hypothetical protein